MKRKWLAEVLSYFLLKHNSRIRESSDQLHCWCNLDFKRIWMLHKKQLKWEMLASNSEFTHIYELPWTWFSPFCRCPTHTTYNVFLSLSPVSWTLWGTAPFWSHTSSYGFISTQCSSPLHNGKFRLLNMLIMFLWVFGSCVWKCPGKLLLCSTVV